MRQFKSKRQMLECYRDWLLNHVIPGYQRRHDEESLRRSVAQLDEIEQQLGVIRHAPRIHRD